MIPLSHTWIFLIGNGLPREAKGTTASGVMRNGGMIRVKNLHYIPNTLLLIF